MRCRSLRRSLRYASLLDHRFPHSLWYRHLWLHRLQYVLYPTNPSWTGRQQRGHRPAGLLRPPTLARRQSDCHVCLLPSLGRFTYVHHRHGLPERSWANHLQRDEGADAGREGRGVAREITAAPLLASILALISYLTLALQ